MGRELLQNGMPNLGPHDLHGAQLGCRKVQGYLFGRPMSATDARALFSGNARSAAA